jgi:hypothetical protein
MAAKMATTMTTTAVMTMMIVSPKPSLRLDPGLRRGEDEVSPSLCDRF